MAKQKTFNDLMLDKYGDDYNQIFITNEEPVTPIPTGSFSLDISIGIGGVPKGRFTVFDGAEGSGKSTIALSICKQALLAGERVLYIDVENQMHFDYMETLLGIEIERNSNFILAKPENSDMAFNICEGAISSKDFGLVILDSIAALSPPEEQEKKFEDASMAIIPRDLAKFFRRNAYKVRTNNVAVVFINQVRDNIGSYVKSYTTPGGHALRHYASLIISLSKAQEIKAGETSIGIMTKFTIKKNKMSAPFRTFMIPIIFGVGVDTTRDLVSYAEFLGVIKRGGPFYKYENETLGKGMLETIEFLENNKEALYKITEQCYNIINRAEVSESEDIDE